MKEPRSSKFGRALANITRPTLRNYSKRDALDYIDILTSRVANYSFRKRRVGEPKHEGCRWSLEDLERVDAENPEEMALFIRASFDMTFNKDRARVMFGSFIDAMENLRDDVIEDTL